MREEERLTPAEAKFEAALAGLQPVGATIDRDQMMYRAGYAAASRRSRMWQGVSVLLATVCTASLVTQTVLEHRERKTNITRGLVAPGDTVIAPGDTVIAVFAAPQHESSDAVNEHSYITLRNDVLEYGLAALPQPSARAEQETPLTIKDLLGEPKGKTERITPTGRFEMSGGRS